MDDTRTEISEGIAKTLTAILEKGGVLVRDAPLGESSFEGTCTVASSFLHNGRVYEGSLYSVNVRNSGEVCIDSHFRELTDYIRQALVYVQDRYPEYVFTMNHSRHPRGRDDDFA